MKLWPMHYAVLSKIGRGEMNDLRKISEPFRQKAIDLGMWEPPLVDVDADRLSITDAGRDILARLGNSSYAPTEEKR